MDNHETHELGLAKNLAVIRKPGTTDKLLFVGQDTNDERWVRVMTFGAAQSLWHYLTSILYPRAADQLTHRAATAALTIPDSPTIVTTFAASTDETQNIIKVRAISSSATWKLHFSKDDGYDLWTALEDILDAV